MARRMNMNIMNILCPPLRIPPVMSSAKPVRITVVGSPQKCGNKANIVNPVLNVIEEPVSFDFIQSLGRYEMNKWNGAIGQLVYNRSDVAIGTFTATYERFQWTQLSTPLGYSSPIAILSGSLSQHSIQNGFQAFNTFEWDVWLRLFMFVLIVGFINNFMHGCNLNFHDIISSIIQSYKSSLAQSVKKFSRVCCSKHTILIGMSLLSFSILIHYFRTLILTNLLDDPLIKIDSIDDLVNFLESTKDNITLVSNKAQLTWQLLEKSQEENFQKIFRQLKNRNMMMNDIYNGKSVAINYGHILESKIKANKHLGLHLSSEQYFGSSINILYSKTIDKSLKNKIDSVISILFESGLQDFYNFVQLTQFKQFNFNQTEDNQIIDLEDMRGLMMLIGIINVSSILVLIIEKFWYILTSKKSKQMKFSKRRAWYLFFIFYFLNCIVVGINFNLFAG